MKLKKNLLLTLIALTLLTVVGCSSKTETAKESETTEVAAETASVTIPEERPQLVGKIKEVIGNEVTIYKVEMNVGTEAANQNETSQNQPDQSSTNQSDQAQNEQNQGTENQDNIGPRQLRPMAFNFTEETETFTIPVGTQIASAGRGTVELMDISDLKAEQTIMMWQQDETVIFVQVMGGNRTTPSNGQGQGNIQGPPGGVPGSGQIVIRGGNRQP